MTVEVEIPNQFQPQVVAGIIQRRGQVGTISVRDFNFGVIRAEVPLVNMFGYSTDLRSQTEGKGEFSMEYKVHTPVPASTQLEVLKKWKQRQADGTKEK